MFCLCTCVSPSVCVWWNHSGPHTREGKNCTGMVPGRRGNSCAGHTWPRLGSRSHSGRNGCSGRPAWTLRPWRDLMEHLTDFLPNDASLPFLSPPFGSLLHLFYPPPLSPLSSSLSTSQPEATPAFSSRRHLSTCARSQRSYLFVLLRDPKALRFLAMKRRKSGNDEEVEDSGEELEEGGEESRERHSKAPCSFADDAALESPLHWDNERCFRGYRGCLDYWCYREPQRLPPSYTWSRIVASLTQGSNQARGLVGEVRRKGDTGTFQWVNQGANNSTVWTDACTSRSDFLFLIPLLLYFPLLLILSLPQRFPRWPQLPTMRAGAKAGAEEACVGGSPTFDWRGRLVWIWASVSEGRAAGF